MKASAGTGRAGAAAVAGVLALAASGCVSYAPAELAAMSHYELCRLETVQRVNLTAPARERLDSELAGRSVNCTAYVPAIQAQLAADLYERTYFNQSP